MILVSKISMEMYISLIFHDIRAEAQLIGFNVNQSLGLMTGFVPSDHQILSFMI